MRPTRMTHTLVAVALTLITARTTQAFEGAFESPEQKVPLIELYTSEGCSSCPTAEIWLGQLKGQSGLWKQFVPVAFHVDYWNNLGWPDRFASAKYTLRQRDHAARWNSSTVYTPAFVVDGNEWRRDERLPALSQTKVGRLQARAFESGEVEVSFTPTQKQADRLVVEIAALGRDIVTNVSRGENAGRKLQHDFVVLGLVESTMVPGAQGEFKARLTLPTATPEGISGIAVWVRSSASLVPIQATGGWFRK